MRRLIVFLNLFKFCNISKLNHVFNSHIKSVTLLTLYFPKVIFKKCNSSYTLFFNQQYIYIYINITQFTQPQQLQNESSPDFMVQVVFLFFEDSMKLLNDLSRTLDQ